MMFSGMLSGVTTRAALTGGLLLAAAIPALARDPSVHTLNVALPNGQVEQIRYAGDVPPQIVFVPQEAAVPVGFDASPFADLERMSAMMDRQMAAMMQDADALSAATPAMGSLPEDASGATYIASFSSDGACTRSTQITYAPGMAKPHEVTKVSGNCGPAPAARPPVLTRDPVAPEREALPHTTLIRAGGGAPRAVLQNAFWQH